jgi:hypothetical protein
VEGKKGIELIGCSPMLASSERKHRGSKARLRRLRTGRESAVCLTKRRTRIRVAPLVHGEVGQKDQCGTGKRVAGVPANELAEDGAGTPGLAGAEQRSCTLVRSSSKERRRCLNPGENAGSAMIATQPKQRDAIGITIGCAQRGASKDAAIRSGGPTPEPALSCRVRDGQLLTGRQPDACIIEDLYCALHLARGAPRSNDRHETTS